jgi:hypothetical protein
VPPSLPAVQDVTRVRAAIIGYSHFRDVPFFQPTLLKPVIYRTGNDVWFADVYQHPQEVLARVRHDYAAMQARGLIHDGGFDRG